jgi:hypothetical protein
MLMFNRGGFERGGVGRVGNWSLGAVDVGENLWEMEMGGVGKMAFGGDAGNERDFREGYFYAFGLLFALLLNAVIGGK